ncbi:NPCBM/NEW2 domain-containing protein [Actinomadura sp. ATCC 31491]|uniref:NPCBM/NEW2 domain-containing protein n=1 Tax=Actinomadura luzonensis TaxID=2805427 RepID=A0ABT0GBI8_9ACTN|nr:NPCBM/NEW2 domain-containing protein [Actinomadura luzonensis]MCK2221957.1 NPCBM/NEW2 domain-containing protein [Actinomadura luzonensis]
MSLAIIGVIGPAVTEWLLDRASSDSATTTAVATPERRPVPTATPATAQAEPGVSLIDLDPMAEAGAVPLRPGTATVDGRSTDHALVIQQSGSCAASSSYRLGGGRYKRFTADAAIPDGASADTSASFTVAVNGRAGSAETVEVVFGRPKHIEFPVENARTLTLSIFACDQDAQAAWMEPTLSR